MSEEIPYDYWREYPDHDPQSFVWYPLSFGPIDPETIWPAEGGAQAVDSSFYIHVPFCAVICPFCPFNKFKSVEEQMREFVRALKTEISILASRRGWGQNPLKAGYFGGGTPTALAADQLCEIIEHLKRELRFEPGFELSVEGSPETLTPEKLSALRSVGVTRISFGVQSFSDHYLKIIGRGHDGAQARRAVEMSRAAGFDDVAIDLIYRLPGQTLEEWRQELETAATIGVTHISAYSLFIEPGSPLAKVQHMGRLLPLPDEVTDLSMFRLAIERLGEAGFELYTLYDFALAGRKSIHHLVNWQAPQAEYVGLGPGAFSFVRNGEEEFVYGNINPLDRYFETLGEGKLPIDFGVQLPLEERRARYMVLGTNATPIPKAPFARRFGLTVEEQFGQEISQLLEWGLIEDHPDRIELTLEGKLYISNVGKMFSTERNRYKPHPAGVDLQKGAGLSLLGIGEADAHRPG